MLKLILAFMLKNARERIHRIMRDKRKMLLLCVLLTVIIVGTVTAYVYSSMFIKSTIVVEN